MLRCQRLVEIDNPAHPPQIHHNAAFSHGNAGPVTPVLALAAWPKRKSVLRADFHDLRNLIAARGEDDRGRTLGIGNRSLAGTVKVRDVTTCDSCETRDCIKGRPDGPAVEPQRGCELALFQPRKIEGVRKSMILNYVTDEWRAREQLCFPETPVRGRAR